MSYRMFLILLMASGLVPSLVFLFFFLVVDRGPSRWDRYSMFILGLALVAALNYGGVLLAVLTGGPTVVVTRPQTVGVWVGLLLRGLLGSSIMWALLVIYLTPTHRDRKHDTPEPGSIPRVK